MSKQDITVFSTKAVQIKQISEISDETVLIFMILNYLVLKIEFMK